MKKATFELADREAKGIIAGLGVSSYLEDIERAVKPFRSIKALVHGPLGEHLYNVFGDLPIAEYEEKYTLGELKQIVADYLVEEENDLWIELGDLINESISRTGLSRKVLITSLRYRSKGLNIILCALDKLEY